jgi:hypothetical protein
MEIVAKSGLNRGLLHTVFDYVDRLASCMGFLPQAEQFLIQLVFWLEDDSSYAGPSRLRRNNASEPIYTLCEMDRNSNKMRRDQR